MTIVKSDLEYSTLQPTSLSLHNETSQSECFLFLNNSSLLERTLFEFYPNDIVLELKFIGYKAKLHGEGVCKTSKLSWVIVWASRLLRHTTHAFPVYPPGIIPYLRDIINGFTNEIINSLPTYSYWQPTAFNSQISIGQ